MHVEQVVRNGAALDFEVVVTDLAEHVDKQRWHLSFATMWQDISKLPLDGARIVTRANIEEWWDTRHSGEPPLTGFTARRLDDPDR
jgi:hypothetical protein